MSTTSGPADLIVTGGRVWPGSGGTADGPRELAIRDGRIVALGDDLAAAWAGLDTRRVDVGGRRVIPGLIDSHIHAIRAGMTYLDELDWTEIQTLASALDSVRTAAAEVPTGQWITALGGWHVEQLGGTRPPTRAELDAVAPEHPVFVHPVYGHDDHGVLNTAGLRAMGWDADGPDPDGGRLHRDPDGRPDGRLSGVAAYQAVVRTALRPTPERAQASTRAFFSRLAALGMTGVIDAGGMGMGPHMYRAVHAVWRAGTLPVRVRMCVGASTHGAEPQEIAAWQNYLAPAAGDDLLSVLGLGEVLHYGCHDWEGMSPFPFTADAYSQLVEVLRSAAIRRWPLTVHAILDESAARILDAMEEVAAETPIAGLRWSLCHVECVSRPTLQRIRALGLAVAVQSRIAHKMAVCAERWGTQVARAAPPLGDIVDLGIPFGAGTDSTRGASYNAWRALSWFVTGTAYDGGPRRDPRHRLSREQALDAYTRGSAWLSFEDGIRGTLEPGRVADFAVLDADYFSVPDDEIAEISADLTLVDGRVVHAGDSFDLPVEHRHPRPAPQDVA